MIKYYFYLFAILSLAAFSSCKKDKPMKDPLLRNSEASACGVKDPVNNLGWLKKIVQNHKKEGTDRYLIIRMADYNGETYFDTALGYSSCLLCNIVDCTGSRIDWQNFTPQQKEELRSALLKDESIVMFGVRE